MTTAREEERVLGIDTTSQDASRTTRTSNLSGGDLGRCSTNREPLHLALILGISF